MCERFVSSILRYSVSCYCFSRQLISKQQWLVRERERDDCLRQCPWSENSSLTLAEDLDAAHPSRRDDNASIVMLNPASPLLTSEPLQFSDEHFIRRIFHRRGFSGAPLFSEGCRRTRRAINSIKQTGVCVPGFVLDGKCEGFIVPGCLRQPHQWIMFLRVWRLGNLIFVKDWSSVLTLADYIYIHQNHHQKVILLCHAELIRVTCRDKLLLYL